MDISSLELPHWALWLAQDADGAWWVYECEPLQHDNGWYENEVGRRLKIKSAEANPNWETTLRKLK